MKAYNIKWDAPKSIRHTLPKEMEIPPEIEDDEDEISDYLSDETGFCHFGFCLKREPEIESFVKEYLFDRLDMLSEYHEDITPNDEMSLGDLVGMYFYWAKEYNDGYFFEMDEHDEISLWLQNERNSII